jgi:hypothetical protein
MDNVFEAGCAVSRVFTTSTVETYSEGVLLSRRTRARENVDRDSCREVSHKRLHKITNQQKFPAIAHPPAAFEYPK